MPITDWEDMMPHTVTRRPATGRDAYGKPTYGAAITYQGRVSYKTKRITSRTSGQDVIASGNVIVMGVIADIHVDDLFTLPDGSIPLVINWSTVADEEGDHHTTVYFGGAGGGSI